MHLKELALGYYCDVTDAGIGMVIRQCNQLGSLKLVALHSITGMCARCEDPEPKLCFITGVCYACSRFMTDHKGPPLDYIVSPYDPS